LPLEFLSGRARFSNQRRRIDRAALVTCAFQCRKDFPVQTAMMFFRRFFSFRCKSAGTFFKVIVAIGKIVTVPCWLSTRSVFTIARSHKWLGSLFAGGPAPSAPTGDGLPSGRSWIYEMGCKRGSHSRKCLLIYCLRIKTVAAVATALWAVT